MKDTSRGQVGLVDMWNLNNRVNLRLLDVLTDEQLGAVILPRGKAVASYFAHLHMARCYWLERRARDLAKTLKKIPLGTGARTILRQSLVASGEVMAKLFAESERTGTLKGAKLGPFGFFSYAIAHEAHHRGQVLLHLKIAGLPLKRAFTYSLWYWNKI